MVSQEEYENIMAGSQMQQSIGMNSLQNQQQLLLQEQEKGLAEEQLDVEEIIDRIYNLLQGNEWKKTDNGYEWLVSKNNQMKVLSEWGIQRVMQVVRFHINKNTLLSNFTEEQINRLMYHFTTEMNDLVLLKYQQLFRKTTLDECKKFIEDKLKEKQEIRLFVNKILQLPSNEIEIRKELIKEMVNSIEKEIDKIKAEELKNKIKEYGLLLWEIEQSVYSTLNRAYMGKERETLRRHAQFTEIRALQPESQKKGGMFQWLKSS